MAKLAQVFDLSPRAPLKPAGYLVFNWSGEAGMALVNGALTTLREARMTLINGASVPLKRLSPFFGVFSWFMWRSFAKARVSSFVARVLL